MLDNRCKLVSAALALIATSTISATARSQEPAAPLDSERAPSSRSPVDLGLRRGEPEDTLFLCKEVTPSSCRGVVAIPALSSREPQIEGWRTEADRAAARVVERGPKANKVARKKSGPRAPMQNGFEPEAIVEPEFRREILLFLANLTGEQSLRRAGKQLPRLATIRALAETQALEDAHRRATYIEIEDFAGPEKTITTPPAMVAGGVLLGTGAIFARVLHGAQGDVRIRPQLWPPGIRIHGTFDVP